MDEYFKLRYMQLAEKVRKMLEAQKAYFRSGKDIRLLKISKALEAEVDGLVNPKPTSQAQIDWLGQ